MLYNIAPLLYFLSFFTNFAHLVWTNDNSLKNQKQYD